MRRLFRWCKFSAVGIMGFAVQLTSVALLNRMLPDHPLIVTALGVEITLLHNFSWHWNFTWCDRRDRLTLRAQLIRFHLSNGVVSMVGNIAMMALLLRYARIPIVLRSAMAILCFSILNFYLAEFWAFEGKPGSAMDRTPVAPDEVGVSSASVDG